jgi:phage terminase large subunit GpA-like protein
MLDWCRRWIQNENGRPYDHNAYPHAGAPGGPCDAFDDPLIREIVLQYASRLTKTFFGQAACLFTAATAPAPMMLVSLSEKLTTDIIARSYTMLEKCPPLAGELLPENRRAGDCIELADCRLYGGWARAIGTLADKDIKVGHANEIDKWERLSTSIEGDPLELFLERAKNYPNYKFVLESTPTIASYRDRDGKWHGSRVERARLASSNCSLYVPCPHCRMYQILKLARLQWDKDENGEPDIDVAFKTARYLCEHCNGEIRDQHRPAMIRMGVWVPEGCGIDHEKALAVAQDRHEQLANDTFSNTLPGHYWQHDYILGTPTRDGYSAGYQLSSLYALSLTWGRIAAKWLSVQGNAINLWGFINGWLGETWKIEKRTEDWEAVSRRLIVDLPRFVCPIWSTFLSAGIDKQSDHYVFVVIAWGPGSTAHVVDYGTHESIDCIHEKIITREYEHADGGPPLRVAKTLIDTGFDPAEPYHYSQNCLLRNPPIVMLACKGSSTSLPTPFKESELGENTLMPGLPLILVDTNWTQGELDRRIYKTRPGEAGALSVFHDAPQAHKDFFKQLLNDEPEHVRNARGNDVVVWNRGTDYPNDSRDCVRYADVAHLMWADGLAIPMRAQSLVRPTKKVPTPLTTEDGRPYLIIERT